MLTNLQALRALAAVAVVIFHVGLMPPTLLPFRVGAAGVDLFFVLSGFIIAYNSSRDARHFLMRRFIRIVPAYWIATIIAALFTLQHLSFGDALGWLGQSLLYLPGPQGRPALIFVAWTLVYELAFYLLYWLALRVGKSRAPAVALGMLLVLAVIRLPGAPGPWPLLLEFAIGIGAYLTTEHRSVACHMNGSAGLLSACAGFVLLAISPHFTGYDPDDYQSLARVLTWGLPAGCIVMGAVIAERSGLAVKNRAVLLLGAASYAVYLLHPIAIGQMLQMSPVKQPASWAMCLGATFIIVALSAAFHRTVEAPLLQKLRRLLRNNSSRCVVVDAA